MVSRALIALTLVLGAFHATAQEQLAVRVSDKGLIKTMEMAVRYGSGGKKGTTYTIPKDLYSFKIKAKDLLANPIVPLLNEISNLNLKKDLPFYLETSPIVIKGKVDEKSVTSKIVKQSKDGFDVQISVNVPSLTVTASDLSLCETKTKSKRCGAGLKASVKNLSIGLKGVPVRLSATFRVKTKADIAKVQLLGITTNLKAKNGPKLAINFGQVIVPPIYISINNQETELDTSKLRNEIIKRKEFLSEELVDFAAEFMSSDMAELVNSYLMKEALRTSVTVIDYQKPTPSYNEFDYDLNRYPKAAVDNTYVYIPKYKYDLGTKSPLTFNNQKADPIKEILAEITKVVHSAQMKMEVASITTPYAKDIELAGNVEFSLNKQSMKVVNRIANSNRPLPDLDLSSYRSNDVTLALSEPVLNAALDLVAKNNIYQLLLDKYAGVQGFYVKNVKIHFSSKDHQDLSKIYIVANAQVDLNKISSNGALSWVKNKIGAWLERNNNNSVIYFPLQLEIIPTLSRDSAGAVVLKARVNSPFKSNNILKNDYHYASNVPAATATVRDSVIAELKKSFDGFVNKDYTIDLSSFLNEAGVVYVPKTVTVWDSGYLILGIDIKDINFNQLNVRK